MGRKRTPKKRLAARASAEASQDMSERGGKSSRELAPGALHQLRAADEAYREGCIATMAECAAMATETQQIYEGENSAARRVANEILTELRRRYKDFPDRIEHHLNLRGLS